MASSHRERFGARCVGRFARGTLGRPHERQLPRRRSNAILGTGLVLAAVAMSGCSSGTSTPQQSESVHDVVKTNAPSFTVDVSAGSLHLVPGPSGRISLQGTVSYRGDQRPTLGWQNGSTQLSFHSVCHSKDQRCRYDYTFTVPVSARVAASVTAGDVSARGWPVRCSLAPSAAM